MEFGSFSDGDRPSLAVPGDLPLGSYAWEVLRFPIDGDEEAMQNSAILFAPAWTKTRVKPTIAPCTGHPGQFAWVYDAR
jgi:hypothetical protein